ETCARGEGTRSGLEAAHARAAPLPALQHRRRADDLDAMVREDGTARAPRARSGAGRAHAHRARGVGEDLRALAHEHPGLVRVAPALVGPPDPRVPLRELQRDPGEPRSAEILLEMRLGSAAPGPGRARHLVLERALAVLDARLARSHAGARPLLPH